MYTAPGCLKCREAGRKSEEKAASLPVLDAMPIAMVEYPILITAASRETKLNLWKLGNCKGKEAEDFKQMPLILTKSLCLVELLKVWQKLRDALDCGLLHTWQRSIETAAKTTIQADSPKGWSLLLVSCRHTVCETFKKPTFSKRLIFVGMPAFRLFSNIHHSASSEIEVHMDTRLAELPARSPSKTPRLSRSTQCKARGTPLAAA